MIDTKLRKNVQPMFDKLGQLFIKLKITPTIIPRNSPIKIL